MTNLTDALSNLCQSNPDSSIFISGDINLPDIDWSNNTIVSHQYRMSINQSFLQLLDRAGLEQMIDFPTRGNNTLDVLVTNRPSLVNKCSSLPGLSDHDVVFMEVSIKASRKKTARHKIHLWSKTNFEDIRNHLRTWANKFTYTFSTNTPVDLFILSTIAK